MMRKSWTKWILIAVIALALIVGVPIIINECYKTNSGYMTIWGAADALSYYGTILGSLVAVATVVVTILFTYKQIQRDSYLRRENEKWFDVESVFSNALNTISGDALCASAFTARLISLALYCKTSRGLL